MKEGKKRNKPAASGVITLACALALGAGAGWLGAWAADRVDFSPLLLAGTLVLAAAGMMGQIILHEAGHLLGGLATGYAFVSFRVGSWMLLKRDGRLHLGRYTLPGTGGQCLMAPPPWKEDGFPALLYNLSGPLANLLAAAVCGAAAWLCRERAPLAALLLGVWALVGAYLGLLNGIPMKIQGMPNDGYNALRLRRDKASLRAVWAQLAINMAQTQGLRLGEVPEDWFSLPGDAGPTDPLKSAVWVCRYSRLLDQGRYQEAAALCDTLLKTGDLALAHRCALQLDQAFFRLADGEKDAVAKALQDRTLKAFARQMKNNPGVALVRWAGAEAQGDAAQARKERRALETALASWPYPGENEAVRQQLRWYEEKRRCAQNKA